MIFNLLQHGSAPSVSSRRRLLDEGPTLLRTSPDTSSESGASFGMTVNVLLFASYADALGASSVEVDVEPGATVADVVRRVQQMPGAERLPTQPLVAVNQRYAKPHVVIASGDEVAIIPPVAGG
jgi:sulfur-carrier protein